jgi:predicted secreted protein
MVKWLVILFITCPMAISQIITSKNPMIGAIYFRPFEIKITRIVPRLTSHIRKKKMRRGRTTQQRNPPM